MTINLLVKERNRQVITPSPRGSWGRVAIVVLKLRR